LTDKRFSGTEVEPRHRKEQTNLDEMVLRDDRPDGGDVEIVELLQVLSDVVSRYQPRLGQEVEKEGNVERRKCQLQEEDHRSVDDTSSRGWSRRGRDGTRVEVNAAELRLRGGRSGLVGDGEVGGSIVGLADIAFVLVRLEQG
jgi:hypothetical protein